MDQRMEGATEDPKWECKSTAIFLFGGVIKSFKYRAILAVILKKLKLFDIIYP